MKTQEQLDRLNKKIIESAKNTNDKMDKEVEGINTSLDSVNVSQSIGFITLCEAGMIDAATAGEHADDFEEWRENVTYKKGQIRRSNGILYTYIYEQDVLSVIDWRPENTLGVMWEVYADPTVEYPQWSQPIGAHDAYGIGDKVTYNDVRYISTTENNVWQPGVYGWELVEV